MNAHLKKTIDHHKTDRWYDKVNKYLAVKITQAVGTMWCAYVFAAIDLLALPQAITQGLFGLVQWTASFFLQLVLLSVIMVGQNLSAEASDARALQTFEDTEKIKDLLNPLTPGGVQILVELLNALPSNMELASGQQPVEGSTVMGSGIDNGSAILQQDVEETH